MPDRWSRSRWLLCDAAQGGMFCEEGARLCAFVSENERGVFYVADKKECKINNRKTIHLWS